MFKFIASRLRGRDLFGVMKLIALNVRHASGALTPQARMRRAADQAFDEMWGTDTSRPVSVHDLDIGRARLAQCNRYEASDVAMMSEPLAALGIDPCNYDFIDYGCGKGRVLMLALQHRFRTVTGIELSARLCDTAQANLDIFARRSGPIGKARIIGADATMFLPSGTNILAYFYNPFDASVMTVVRRRLEHALRTGTQRVVVIYANAEHAEVFADAAGWTRGLNVAGATTFVAEELAFRTAAKAA